MSDKAILPGATLGMLGGGQLGRMFVMAAHSLGYRVAVLDPDSDSPAGRIAEHHIKSSYDDKQALQQMSELCEAITTEFENVPTETLQVLEQTNIVRPSAKSVKIAQNRIQEKKFLAENNFPTAKFYPIQNENDIRQAMSELNSSSILKVATFGYDGKGQAIVNNVDEALQAFNQMDQVACVLEQKVELASEVSVVLCRSHHGQISAYPVGENVHVNGILETTLVPSTLDQSIQEQALSEAKRFAEQLDYCGVLAVEFFYTKQGKLLINEVAPRPHNSGHYTLDACICSQFEQQVRMLCGLPAGSTEIISPVVMFNLLGDIWQNGEPDWWTLLAHENVKLHLYGKSEARNGRKMGHFNCLGLGISDSGNDLLKQAHDLAEDLPQTK
ncbi:MAG: 5-(carboxyamino)imidazole ribonucleotide synthase [Gammaproteobacteria bacterium]|nr:5-(carboxyamino)imidazole ribonucleotide synthase [Gammaproteobacteria bacterium]